MGCIQKTRKPQQKQDNHKDQELKYHSEMPILKLWSIDESSNKIKQLSPSSQQNMYELAFQNEFFSILNKTESQRHTLNGRSIRKCSTTISPVQGILKNSNQSPQYISNKKKQRVNFSTGCNFQIGQNLKSKQKTLFKDKQL